ncbi:hypothetical protein ADL00_37205 [Streptomyces sp. AS58]|uniref:Uncharacterized protein n=1 Tax=Streptomyces cadmiisoli TaxID=2184053 RepID=A0A2Z4ISB1_9ACTN|nr:hypothetical protein DN051_00870 [Streptomyces cadmiisoli]AWW42023.1 hypothetical protein DN051_39940 [Streptomyces cadmiisoli]KOV52566.1 hypothetical protein ADL00_37205 [Streptomyces sp. AS58]
MSDKGFDLPKEAGKVDFGDRQDAYRVASDACRKKIGKAPQVTGERSKKSAEELKEEHLKTLQCFRDNGAEVTDPGANQAPQIEFPEGVSQDAFEECYKK